MALKDYLHSYLGSNLASQLGFSLEANSYDFIVTETLDRLNITTEDEVDSKVLHTVGKVCLWESILREVSFDYDVSADGSSSKRSQLFDHVAKMYLDAVNDALPYLPEYQIEIGTFDSFDPYKYRG